MPNRWFVKVGRIKHAGPFTAEELQEMVQQRKLQPATQVCRELNGQPDGRWEHASTVTGLLPHIAPVPQEVPPPEPVLSPDPLSSTSTETPEVVPQSEPQDGMGAPALMALWSGVFAIFLIGAAIVYWINDSSDERQNERDQQVAVLLEQANTELAANHLKEAKQAAVDAQKIPGSSKQADIRKVLAEIAKRQTFLDKRVKDLVAQAEQKLKKNDLDGAKVFSERASTITLATNYALAQALAAKIRGIEQAGGGFGGGDLSKLVSRVKPNVVKLKAPGGGFGSGFVVDGYVISNMHVVANSTMTGVSAWIEVSFKDGKKALAISYHLVPKKDIAVLQVPPLPSDRSLVLAAEHPKQGESVAALGHPRGLNFSITKGIVSAIRSADEVAMAYEKPPGTFAGTWIQTDSALSSGNSGGPLVNDQGDVVAMNTRVMLEKRDKDGNLQSVTQNLNFSIASPEIREAIEEANRIGMTRFQHTRFQHR